MTVQIDVKPETATKFQVAAAALNLSLQDYLDRIATLLYTGRGNGAVNAERKEADSTFHPGIDLPPGVSAQDIWDGLKTDAQSDEDDPDSLSRAMAQMTNRTPEQIEATRAEVMRGMPEPLPIPPGKTVFDMLFRIRGKETDEQVYQALERLS